MKKFSAEIYLSIIGLGMLGGFLSFAAVSIIHNHRFPHRCADYKIQSEAQAVYDAGATYLDHNGDGEACNDLPA